MCPCIRAGRGSDLDAVLAECGARLLIEEGSANHRLQNRIPLPWPEWRRLPLAIPATRRRSESSSPLPSDDGPRTPPSSSSPPVPPGSPKGVELSHRAVSAFVRWTAREFHIAATDRIACPSPLGFDLSTFDIFNMALCGATAVLVPENIAWMPRFLVQFLREARISCWYSVPSILAGMLREGAHGRAFLSAICA